MQSVYGLIGYPLSHSFSPEYFAEKFGKEAIDAVYRLFPIPTIQELPAIFKEQKHIKGVNVTIPYKEQALPFLDVLDETAFKVGAVNCIKYDGTLLTGYNTDVIGFEHSLKPLLKPHHTWALVLGTGGAAKAVTYVLDKLNIKYQLVSSSGKENSFSYQELTREHITNHPIIVNTTPLGMYPNIDDSPNLPYEAITEHHLLYDLIYNPLETTFLKKGKQHNATIQNGLKMLELQAEASWDIWNS